MLLEQLLMAVLLLVTLGVFTRRVLQLVGLLQLGADDDRKPQNWYRKIKDQLVVVFLQRKLLQWAIPGVMHFLIFWGFVILFTTIVEAFGAVFKEGFAIPLIGRWWPLGALQDFFVVAVLVGIAMALAIRKIQRPGRFRGSHLKEADYILYAITGIMITILLTRGAEISLGHFPYDTRWTPLSNGVAQLFDGLSLGAREAWGTVFLWWHSLIILGFLVYITYSKHLHIVTAGINVLFTSERPKGALKPMDINIEDMSEDDTFGVAKMTDLTWKQLLDGMTCTECGRCQSVCPAWNTGKPLSPKLLIMDIRDHMFEHGPALLEAKKQGPEAYQSILDALPPMNPDIIEDEDRAHPVRLLLWRGGRGRSFQERSDDERVRAGGLGSGRRAGSGTSSASRPPRSRSDGRRGSPGSRRRRSSRIRDRARSRRTTTPAASLMHDSFPPFPAMSVCVNVPAGRGFPVDRPAPRE